MTTPAATDRPIRRSEVLAVLTAISERIKRARRAGVPEIVASEVKLCDGWLDVLNRITPKPGQAPR